MNRLTPVGRQLPGIRGLRQKSSGAGRRYWAFLSYAHADARAADRLHRALESFVIPRQLAGKKRAFGIVPEKLTPIFRDRHELAASADLGETIRAAIAASRYFIVLCSPAAAKSRWVDQEILDFKRRHGEERVLAAIIDGEPFASAMPGREDDECFPAALRFHIDEKGKLTDRPAEPIAADLREHGDGWRTGVLKLVAGMIGVGLDDLVQRETARRQRRLKIIAGLSLLGMALTSGLAAVAIDSRNTARDERREAEGLVAFMLGDLRDELEPIGRLDALDKVGERALAYFERQDKGDLPEEQLAQRSKALAMMGEIALQRGDLDGAAARYAEALRGSQELIRREPDNPDRLYDHIQSLFLVGELASRRGRLADAEKAFRDYETIADKMVALRPGERKFQMEKQYAAVNLGYVLKRQRAFGEASQRFERAVAMMERLAAAEPANEEYRKNLTEGLAWLADAKFGEGKIDAALAARSRQVALLEEDSARSRDVDYKVRLFPAQARLGTLLVATGAQQRGLDMARRAVQLGNGLMKAEPDNLRWKWQLAAAQFDLASALRASGRATEAGTATEAGCALTARSDSVSATDATYQMLVSRCLLERTRDALARGDASAAVTLADRARAAVRAASAKQPYDNPYLLPEAQWLYGRALAESGDRDAARQAFAAGLRGWPRGGGEPPDSKALRMQLLGGLGQRAEAVALRRQLAAIGYRQDLRVGR